MTEPRPPKPLRLTEEIKVLIAARADLPPTAKTPDTKILLSKDALKQTSLLTELQDTNSKLTIIKEDIKRIHSKSDRAFFIHIIVTVICVLAAYEYGKFRDKPRIDLVPKVEACSPAHVLCQKLDIVTQI